VSDDQEWYVIARDPPGEGEKHVTVFGEFNSETDARSYALDLQNDDDGWETIEALQMSRSSAEDISTDGKIHWPYVESEPEE
jgi:hypothetical protein